MPLRPDHCPGDREDIAKSYVMCSLPRTDVAAFQEHLASCIACRRAVEDADKYGKAMREATRRLRSEHGRTG
jgi:hypothetical protein